MTEPRFFAILCLNNSVTKLLNAFCGPLH